MKKMLIIQNVVALGELCENMLVDGDLIHLVSYYATSGADGGGHTGYKLERCFVSNNRMQPTVSMPAVLRSRRLLTHAIIHRNPSNVQTLGIVCQRGRSVRPD